MDVFPVTDPIEGTTLYMDPRANEYLEWVWEIPISPDVVSVGYVTTGAARRPGASGGFRLKSVSGSSS